MAHRRPQPFVAIRRVLQSRYPDLADVDELVAAHRVLVDEHVVTNPNARVRRDARIRNERVDLYLAELVAEVGEPSLAEQGRADAIARRIRDRAVREAG